MDSFPPALECKRPAKSARHLCFMTTHVLGPGIIDEFAKLEKSGIDAFLFIDNRKRLLPGENGRFVTVNLFGKDTLCYLSDESDLIRLGLPRYCYGDRNASIDKTLWYNCDYSFYIIHSILPHYDFYWRLEYDCFYNDMDYHSFFEPYAGNNSDLVGHEISTPPPGWPHIKNVDWIYPQGTNFLKNFFPIERLSNRAIRRLYQTRLQHAKIFKMIKDQDARWPICELLCSTEISRSGMSWSNLVNCGRMTASKTIDLNSERIFMHPDKKIYHPIKPLL